MKKIDTTNWKEFRIGDLFEIALPSDDLQAKKLEDGKIPLISSGKANNGICKYIEKQRTDTFKGNVITVDMFGKAFFQPIPFYAVSHGRVNILIPKFNLTHYSGLFISKVIEIMTSYKYSFSEMCSTKSLLNEKIKLPVCNILYPDFEYMGNYMKKIEKCINISLKSLQKIEDKYKTIDVKEWKAFKVGDLFEIYPTKAYKETNNMLFDENGKNPVIVNSSYNNGIGGYTNKAPTEKGGIITFSDTTNSDSIFYQDRDFVGYPHVQGLHPINEYKNKWNKNRLQFFASIFKSSAKNKNYDYLNKFTRTSASNLTIYLPVNQDGSPDFEYMDEYIQNVYRGGALVLQVLTALIK